AVLTLNRHDQRNALTGNKMIDHIEDTCAWANANQDVSVLIITGAGSAFSAGGNIKNMANRSGEFGGHVGDVAQSYRDGIQRIPMAVQSLEVPVIAAVNGPAIGAGCDLACMCDIRLASEDAVFGETFVNLGLIPGDGGAYFLQRIVGFQRAAEMTLTGRLVKAQEALEIGLVLELTSADGLMDRAHELASAMASKPPITTRYTKRLLKLGQQALLKDVLDQCAFFQGVCHQTEDHHEAVMAFLEKRPAQFKGQ
ncbi:MAG: enoyl-CoA hydratase-related protein, partial [Alphaproteobacteria bacterium]|nr:enoyl-CoA hydratase-related protein [Alphaproteobacteria bacterium]